LRKDLAKMGDSLFYSIATAILDPLYDGMRRLRSAKNSTGCADASEVVKVTIIEIRSVMRLYARERPEKRDALRRSLPGRIRNRIAILSRLHSLVRQAESLTAR
jgi:hypothetical protein